MSSSRSRRSGGGAKNAAFDALARLKEAKAGGKRRAEQVILKDDGDVYQEMDEEEYKAFVEQRRAAGDFVEDDGEGGYADDGGEDWDFSEDGTKTKKLCKCISNTDCSVERNTL